jgi:hypothetical protein
VYTSVLAEDREIPAWIDEALKRATSPHPEKRYAELSEFVYDLRHPNETFLRSAKRPLLERNPVAFWRGLALVLVVIVVLLLLRLRELSYSASTARSRSPIIAPAKTP